MVPVVYETVLAVVPGMHARPAVLPPSSNRPAPKGGYDFVLHVGVAGPGSLRLENLARKTGYNLPDAEGQYAPVVITSNNTHERGFDKDYENFPDVLHTKLETHKLMEHLKASGIEVSNINSPLYGRTHALAFVT